LGVGVNGLDQAVRLCNGGRLVPERQIHSGLVELERVEGLTQLEAEMPSWAVEHRTWGSSPERGIARTYVLSVNLVGDVLWDRLRPRTYGR